MTNKKKKGTKQLLHPDSGAEPRAHAHTRSERAYTERLKGPTICVRPADNGAEFHLHVSQLEKKSGYFKSLQSSGMREARESKVTFNFKPDACRAFEAVAQYLYEDTYEPEGSSEAERCIEAAYVFVLADRLLMSDLKSLAFAKLCNILDRSENNVKAWQGDLPEYCRSCSCGGWGTSSRWNGGQLQQREPIYLKRLKVTSEDSLFSHDQIEEMREVLYDGCIELDNEPVPPAVIETTITGSDGRDSKHAENASDAAWSDAECESHDSNVFAGALRHAQLAFSKHLSQHLPALQADGGFKRLLASGSLDGPFMVDLICTHHENRQGN